MTLANGNENGRRRLPPYISYRTFRNFLDQFLQVGVPERIDRDYWKDRLSGSSGTQLMTALRFLALIDADNAPTPRLKSLVYARGSQRTDFLKQMISEAYGFLSGAVNPQTGSYAQIEAAFHHTFQLKGDVGRKCIKFYIAIAGDAGLILSPSITNRVRSAHSGTGTGIVSKKKSAKIVPIAPVEQKVELLPESMAWDKLLFSIFPSFDPTWKDETMANWLKAYVVANVLAKIPPLDPAASTETKLSWLETCREILKMWPGNNGH